MARKLNGIELVKYDDLFKTDAEREADQQERVQIVPAEQVFPYGSRFPPQVSPTRFSPLRPQRRRIPLALPLWVLYRLAAAVKSIDIGCGPICPCFLKKRTLRVIQQTGTFVPV